ncbi:HigA family addiction module antitoxin [Xanthomonas hydrangeae]|uniref:HigA family addiction module antitoxin n=2 Tax=Xanthomonas TaxID=338 RepID=UPI0035171194
MKPLPSAQESSSNMPTQSDHPGKRLAKLLAERNITPYRCATDMRVSKPRIYELAKCQGSVTPALALRLGLYFGDGAEEWMSAQTRYDLAIHAIELHAELKNIRPLKLSDAPNSNQGQTP